MNQREASSLLLCMLMVGAAGCPSESTPTDDEIGASETAEDTETGTEDATETGTTTEDGPDDTTESTTTEDGPDDTTESTTDEDTTESTETGTETATETGTETATETGTTDGIDLDMDDDGIEDVMDNCPAVPNADQIDDDMDQAGDACDNCLDNFNPDQGDADMDLVGDWCDEEPIDDLILYVPEGAEIELAGDHCYEEVRVFGGISVTPWNGMSGGSLVITSTSSILIGPNGWIDGAGAGRAGGAKSPQGGTGGYGGDGMGRGCGGGPGNSVGQGGSGAGYGGTGGTPNNIYGNGNVCGVCSQAVTAHCEGTAGAAQGTQNGADLDMGSGGGAGGNSSGCTNAGAPGARGGASVVLAANDLVTIDGAIMAYGQQPPTDDSNCGYRPGGGAGSGGGILIAADLVDGAGTLDASGGNGGQALGETNGQTWGWAGGGGGGGRIKIFGAEMFNGSTDVTGGLGGVAPNTGNSVAGDPGTAGTVGGDAMIPAQYADLICN